MTHVRRSLAALMFACVFTVSANAITWFPEEFTCPIDNEKNTFLVVGSYGSYIYSYPSKYQWLFFPATDSPTYYLCKKCHLATFMWDFDKLPKDKLNAIREILKEVKAPKAFKEYTEVPVVERMAIMEKVYGQLGKDDEWWERFYRTKGYHLAKEGHAKEAVEARKRSLEMVRKFINDEKNESSKKLLLYIAGAMNHFIGDDEAAVKDFDLALKTRYAEKGASAEDVASGEAGLNERLNEYIRLVRSSTDAPRKSDSSDSHDH